MRELMGRRPELSRAWLNDRSQSREPSYERLFVQAVLQPLGEAGLPP